MDETCEGNLDRIPYFYLPPLMLCNAQFFKIILYLSGRHKIIVIDYFILKTNYLFVSSNMAFDIPERGRGDIYMGSHYIH